MKQDITGQRFGRLTIIEQFSTTKDTPSMKDKRYYWVRCKCDCGNEVVIRKYNVTEGLTRSCGCLLKEQSSKRMTAYHDKYRESIKDRRCSYCGSEEVYARGLCRNCYNRLINRGTAEYAVRDKTKRAKEQRKEINRNRLNSYIASTPMAERYLKYILQGKTFQEVADIFGVSKQCIHQALKR